MNNSFFTFKDSMYVYIINNSVQWNRTTFNPNQQTMFDQKAEA